MTDKELRRLSRRDLMQLLLEQSKELEALRTQLAQAQDALQDRSIRVEQAGSIAQAALQLNGVFEAAQAACEQYTENIRQMSVRLEAESRARADALLAQARQEKAEIERATKEECARLLAQAKAQQGGDDTL